MWVGDGPESVGGGTSGGSSWAVGMIVAALGALWPVRTVGAWAWAFGPAREKRLYGLCRPRSVWLCRFLPEPRTAVTVWLSAEMFFLL